MVEADVRRTLTPLVTRTDESRAARRARRILDDADRLLLQAKERVAAIEREEHQQVAAASSAGEPTPEPMSRDAAEDMTSSTAQPTAPTVERGDDRDQEAPGATAMSNQADQSRAEGGSETPHPSTGSTPESSGARRSADTIAAGSVTPNPAPGEPAAASAHDVLDTLAKLSQLHQTGALTDKEYEEKKIDLLGRL
jgi:hypothetical protein